MGGLHLVAVHEREQELLLVDGRRRQDRAVHAGLEPGGDVALGAVELLGRAALVLLALVLPVAEHDEGGYAVVGAGLGLGPLEGGRVADPAGVEAQPLDEQHEPLPVVPALLVELGRLGALEHDVVVHVDDALVLGEGLGVPHEDDAELPLVVAPGYLLSDRGDLLALDGLAGVLPDRVPGLHCFLDADHVIGACNRGAGS